MCYAFTATGILYLLFCILGIITRISDYSYMKVDISECQKYFYSQKPFDFSEYWYAVRSFCATKWFLILLAAMFLLFIGRYIRRSNPIFRRSEGNDTPAFVNVIAIASFFVIPVIMMWGIVPLLTEKIALVENPYSHVAGYGILHIPTAEHYQYFHCVSIIILSLISSVYAMYIFFRISQIPSQIRRMPLLIYYVLCLVSMVLFVLVYYPLFSMLLPLLLVALFFIVINAAGGIFSLGSESKASEHEHQKALREITNDTIRSGHVSTFNASELYLASLFGEIDVHTADQLKKALRDDNSKSAREIVEVLEKNY